MEYKDVIEQEYLEDDNETIKKHALEILHMLSGLKFADVRIILNVVEDSISARILNKTFEMDNNNLYYARGTFHCTNDLYRDAENEKLNKLISSSHTKGRDVCSDAH